MTYQALADSQVVSELFSRLDGPQRKDCDVVGAVSARDDLGDAVWSARVVDESGQTAPHGRVNHPLVVHPEEVVVFAVADVVFLAQVCDLHSHLLANVSEQAAAAAKIHALYACFCVRHWDQTEEIRSRTASSMLRRA
eukprot:scaffold316506_cov35-Prasinocladus_malaysianus.AAC.1